MHPDHFSNLQRIEPANLNFRLEPILQTLCNGMQVGSATRPYEGLVVTRKPPSCTLPPLTFAVYGGALRCHKPFCSPYAAMSVQVLLDWLRGGLAVQKEPPPCELRPPLTVAVYGGALCCHKPFLLSLCSDVCAGSAGLAAWRSSSPKRASTMRT
eukprot:1159945-Pelagomonas_calceolata.AAC.13